MRTESLPNDFLFKKKRQNTPAYFGNEENFQNGNVNESVMEIAGSHTAPSTSVRLLKLYSSLKCLNLIVLKDKSIKNNT